jgi:AP2 domain
MLYLRLSAALQTRDSCLSLHLERRLCTERPDGTANAEQLRQVPIFVRIFCRGVDERILAQTSRFHGVRLNKRTGKWEAYIRVYGRHVHLGCHDSEVAAAQAFDQVGTSWIARQ